MDRINIENLKHDFLLPINMREELKIPLGELITIEPTKTLIKLVDEEQPPLVVFVGDYCVHQAIEHNFIPNLSIIDGRNLREPFDEISIENAKIVNSINPQATITIDTWKIIRELFSELLENKEKQPIILYIDGEEDLLVLPVVLELPENSFVVYGQPHEGIVLLNVTPNVKLKCKKLIERMMVENNEDRNHTENTK
ncbi:MAG: DUF359 domain-containing protein [Asgard group archaeon]|nr:DUF359 domain-containing protein [Asgard group archaeon]